MDVSQFDYDLPPELIAQTPPPERGSSRLLVLDRRSGRLEHAAFTDLPELLVPGDLLVTNDSRVFPARLLGHRVPSGGSVECLLLGPGDGDRWDALVHPGQKLQPGARMAFSGGARVLHGEILERHFFGRRLVRLWAEDGGSVTDAIEAIGHVPLPPYIHRADEAIDRERYQTVYARERGSIAAPTAGLHFTPELLDRIEARGVERAAVTLHVGYGTFKPVRVDRVEDHAVDPEVFTIGEAAAAAINRAVSDGRRVIPIGTTTTRALESSARAGDGAVRPASRERTDLFIYPGFEFRIAAGLVTNFHLPRSSLLMLVCAFGGRERVLAAYAEAVRRRYRFYSYGDAMLVV
jgi:S-adenosylmethionine:tRNA ribosyltransferase-isomerase